MNQRHIVTVLSVAALFLSRRAEADPSDADRATARALAAHAHRALENRDYATAAEEFTRADDLVHAPTLLLELARAQTGLGKLVSAQETYNRILREGVAANAPRVFADAVESARLEVAALAPRMAWVTVTVTGVANAKVLVDGVAIPSAAVGVPRAVDPGQHVVTALTEGGSRTQAMVTVPPGRTESVTLALSAAAPDGPSPVPRAATQQTLGFVSLGVGGAGLVAGGVTGALVLGLHGGLAQDCPDGRCPATVQPRLDHYNTLGLISTLGFVAGGAVAGLGVVLLVTRPKREGASVSAMVGSAAGGGVLGAAGRF